MDLPSCFLCWLAAVVGWGSPGGIVVSTANGGPSFGVERESRVVLPHPMPDGHIDRDIQILVHDLAVTVDVRMAASDLTWIEIIRMAGQRTRPAGLQRHGLDRFYVPAERPGSSPTDLPTVEEDVAEWLLHEPNRQLLERWIASCCRLAWESGEVEMSVKPLSRPDSRHHWSITFQMKFQLSDRQEFGTLQWQQESFIDYPGKVRRAIKTRGEAMIESTDVSPLVVRAEHEILDEDSTPEQRCEIIAATLRLPINP